MNVTLLSIHLATSLFIPTMQFPSFSQKVHFAISQSSFSKFSESIISINSILYFSQVIKCNFNRFLKPAISFISSDNFSLFNKNFYNYHEYFTIGQLTIDSCSFKSCRSRSHSGGAIFSICPTVIINSYFYYCFADSGGAICSFSDINLTNTQIRQCSSNDGGGLSAKFGDLCANSSSISFCTSSDNGGAISHVNSGQQNINDINCSYCSSEKHSSAFYFSSKFSSVSSSIFSFCKSMDGIGGICIYGQRHEFVLKMNDCCFSRMKAKEKATSIYIDDFLRLTKSSFSLSNSYFYKCSKKNKITSIHCPKISSFYLTGCLFSNSLEVEIDVIKFKNSDNYFDCDDNKFNLKKIPKRKFFIIPHPDIVPLKYIIEFADAIKLAILFSIYLSAFILLIYEIILVFKKIKIHNN